MPTPDEECAFLGPILAAYGRDGPRLIYADYLDESELPADIARAEFIRVQLALARLDDEHSQRRTLVRRQNELLLSWRTEWTKGLRGLISGCEFRRGLLDTVSVDSRFFCERGERLFRNSAVRRVKFLDAGARIDKLAQCPALANIRELDLCGNDLGNGGLNLLLRSPHLGRLESLDLSFNGIGDSAMHWLACTRAFPRLKALHLNDNRTIGCAGLASLAASDRFQHLRTLDLSGNDVADAGLAAVCGSAAFPRLDRLRIHANRIGDAGIEALAQSELLGRLLKSGGKLDLRENTIGAAGIRAMGASPAVVSVRSLDLGGNHLRDDGVLALVEAEFFTGVHKLSLRQNRIGDPGARHLAYSEMMSRLEFADVSCNRITAKAIELLWAKRKDFRTVLDGLGQFGLSGASSGY